MLRFLIQRWLQDMARRKVQEAVMKAGESKSRGEAEPGLQACDVGFVFALGVESAGLEDLLKDPTTIRGDGFTVRRGDLGNRRAAIAICGAGRENAARATEALLVGHKPKLVISAGFAGGLAPELHRGDLVLADRVRREDGDEIPIDPAILPVEVRGWPRLAIGRLLTVDRVIYAPEEKRALHAKHEALAVDMETVAVAEVCRRRSAPLLAVRVILDTAADKLPREVENLLDQRSTAGRMGAVLGALVNRPGSAKDLYRLKENSLIASDRLAKFLMQCIVGAPLP